MPEPKSAVIHLLVNMARSCCSPNASVRKESLFARWAVGFQPETGFLSESTPHSLMHDRRGWTLNGWLTLEQGVEFVYTDYVVSISLSMRSAG